MSPKEKDLPKYTKSKEGPSIFKEFIEKEEKGQLYARVDFDKFVRFKKLCANERLSMAQGVEIALDLMFDYYEKQLKKLK